MLVTRNLWRKLHVMNVFKQNGQLLGKIGQTKFNLSAGESEAKFRNIRTVYESKTDVFDGFGADDNVA